MGITFFVFYFHNFALRKAVFYYNIYKDIYVFFEEYGMYLSEKSRLTEFSGLSVVDIF